VTYGTSLRSFATSRRLAAIRGTADQHGPRGVIGFARDARIRVPKSQHQELQSRSIGGALCRFGSIVSYGLQGALEQPAFLIGLASGPALQLDPVALLSEPIWGQRGASTGCP